MVNRPIQISVAKMAAKAELEAEKSNKQHGHTVKGKAGNQRPVPMNSMKPLPAMFYRLKSGHTSVGLYLKRIRNLEDDTCWRCGGRGITAAQPRERFFHHCS